MQTHTNYLQQFHIIINKVQVVSSTSRVARFLWRHGAKRWQKVAQNWLISIHITVSSDSKSSPKLAIKSPNSSQSQILGRQRLPKVAQSVPCCPIWQLCVHQHRTITYQQPTLTQWHWQVQVQGNIQHYVTFMWTTEMYKLVGIPVNGGPKFNYCVKGYYPVCMASWVV